MRQLAVFAVFAALTAFVNAAPDDPVKCSASGAHICCGSCVNSVNKCLEGVKGLTDVKVDRPGKMITFTADSAATATKAAEALEKAGFGFAFKAGDKEVAMSTAKAGEKRDTVVLTGVHCCCPACVSALNGLYDGKETKITVEAKGVQRTVTVSGKNLVDTEVLDTFRKAGFTGTIEAKK